MRLLFFTIQISFLGGLSRIVIEKINWFADHGYDVILCNIERMSVNPAYPLDPRVKMVRGDISTTPGNALTRIKGVLGAFKRVQQIIREEKPDVIFNAHCPLVTWILPFLKKNGGLSLFRDKRMPVIMEMHQSRQGLDVFNARYLSPTDRFLHHYMIRWIYSKYDRFVMLTSEDAKIWNLKNGVVIPNFTTMQPRPESDIVKHEGKHSVVVLARLAPQKRIDLMIKVWEKVAKTHPDWEINFMGEGIERPALEKQIKDAGLNTSCHLRGEVTNVLPWLDNAEILALTSEHEGFGIVLIEAMMRSVPVIAFEYVGVRDIIDDGGDGYVIPFGDIDSYAKKLSSLMDSEKLRKEFRQKAFTSVKKFDKENVMKMWEDLINNFK